MNQPLAALALAAAALLGSGRPGSGRLPGTVTAPVAEVDTRGDRGRLREMVLGGLAVALLAWAVTGSPWGAGVAAACGCGLAVVLRRIGERPARADDAVELAASWAELAVCLEAGLPVASAVAAAAASLDGSTGVALRRVAGLLELGADPAVAWRVAQDDVAAAAFARTAARSAATGAALARTARAESTRVREALTDIAEARAQRAGVLIAAPLGLCFLPAFLVLGVAPVVIGLAGEVLPRW
jgi:Flp pilus assembly protein TadB